MEGKKPQTTKAETKDPVFGMFKQPPMKEALFLGTDTLREMQKQVAKDYEKDFLSRSRPPKEDKTQGIRACIDPGRCNYTIGRESFAEWSKRQDVLFWHSMKGEKDMKNLFRVAIIVQESEKEVGRVVWGPEDILAYTANEAKNIVLVRYGRRETDSIDTLERAVELVVVALSYNTI